MKILEDPRRSMLFDAFRRAFRRASGCSSSLGTPLGGTSSGASVTSPCQATRHAMEPLEPRVQPCEKKLFRQDLRGLQSLEHLPFLVDSTLFFFGI